MSSNKEIQCAMAWTANGSKLDGAVIDDDALETHLKSQTSKANYALGDHAYMATLGEKSFPNIPKEGLLDKTVNLFEKAGIPMKPIIGELLNAEDVLGKDITEKVGALQIDHRLNFGQDDAMWDAHYKSAMKHLGETYMDGIEDPMLKNYANKYFKYHENGGALFGRNSEVKGPFQKVIDNAVSNVISNNPYIGLEHLLETAPKAFSWTTQEGDPLATIRGVADAFKATGGNLWKELPDLHHQGVYGFREREGINLLGIHDLLEITERPIRNIAYHIGEAVGKGRGMEALEKISFVSRLGNEPMFQISHSSKSALLLMRYAVSATKFYGGMLNAATKGDKNAILALTVFSAINAAQTGTSASIPVPLDYALTKGMGDDYHQALHDFDDKTGLDFMRHFLGTDQSEGTRPLGGIALGVGGSIASSDLTSGYSGIGKAASAIGEGDYTNAAVQLGDAAMSYGQLAKIPGVNIFTKRAVDALASVSSGKIDASDYLTEVAKRNKLLVDPK